MSSSCLNRPFTASFSNKIALGLLSALPCSTLIARGVEAQVIPAGNDTQSVVDIVGSQYEITGGQSSEDGGNLFHRFEQFDIGAEQTANFVAEPSVQNIISTVSGNQASAIDGTLQVSDSDASLYLINPNGVLLGPNANLNLNGGFSATTATGLEFGEEQLSVSQGGAYTTLVGDPSAFRFESESGSIVNLGELSVSSGESINLIGGSVVNVGNLDAPQGSITTAAVGSGSVVRISQGEQLLSFEIEASDDGRLLDTEFTPMSIGEMLTGDAIDVGETLFVAEDGTVQITRNEQTGFVLGSAEQESLGGSVVVGGRLTATGDRGGNINVLGEQVALQGAILDASGEQGGGLIRVGGDYKGQSAIASAVQTSVDSRSHLIADAIDAGEGGNIVVWADEETQYAGHLSARGGAIAGDGGFVEVSGKERLTVAGSVDLGAMNGRRGSVLFDPENIVITDDPGDPDIGGATVFSSLDIENISATADVVLEATNNIKIGAITGNLLTLSRGSSLELQADSDQNDVGSFQMNAADTIRVEEGNISISGAGITAGNLVIDPRYSNSDDNDPAIGNIALNSSQWLEVGNIQNERGSVVLSGSEVSAGIIDTSTEAHNGGGNQANGRSSVIAGDVDIRSEGGVIVKEIAAYGLLTSVDHHSPDGGDVVVTAENGDIRITDTIRTYSYVTGSDKAHESGNGGRIELNAANSIFVDNNIGADISVDAGTLANSHDVGNGGSISLEATNGQIVVSGDIKTTAEALGRDLSETNTTFGRAGAVQLTANGDITTDNIRTSAIAATFGASSDSGEGAGEGGNVTITSTEGNAVIGTIDSVSVAFRDIALGGGDVTIIANNVESEGIDTSTRADSRAGNSGSIEIIAQGTVDITDEIETFSYARDGAMSGEAGDVSIIGNQITTRRIEAWSLATKGESLAGGDVSIAQSSASSGNFALIDGDIQTYSFAGEEDSGAGGNVLIDFGQNTTEDLGASVTVTGRLGAGAAIETSSIAQDDGDAERGGSVNIYADIITLDDISTQSFGEDDSKEAGDVLLRGDRGITVGNILAPSSHEQLGNIELVGDLIDITGDRIFGEVVRIRPSTESQDIRIGFDEQGSSALDISATELATIQSRVEIGQETSTGTVILSDNVVGMENAPDVEILGGDRLIGPTRLSAALTYQLEGEGRGSLEDTSIRFSNIEEILGGSGDDNFQLGAGVEATDFDVLDGGAGINRVSYADLAGQVLTLDLNQTTLNNLQIVGPTTESILIGTNQDTVWNLISEGKGTINNSIEFENFDTIQGGTGIDTLDYSNYGQTVTVDLEGVSTGLSGFSGIESFIGSGSNNDRFIGSARSDTFSLGARNSVDTMGDIVAFADFENVDGGEGDNTFLVEQNTPALQIFGGSNRGNGLSQNRIVANSRTANWTITERNRGTLELDSNSLNFREIQHIENRSESLPTEAEIVVGDVEVLFTQPNSQVTGSINSGSSNLTLIGNDISVGNSESSGNITGGSITGSGRLTIKPEIDSVALEIGGLDGFEANTLNITDGELSAIQDGFREIQFGDRAMTGDISLGNTVRFNNSISLISQGAIDTTGGRLIISQGNLLIESGENIQGNTIESLGGDVSAIAQENIQLGNVTTVGTTGSGNIDITAANGAITTGGLVTSEINNSGQAGSVRLSSPGNIEIAFIEAEGRGQNLSGEDFGSRLDSPLNRQARSRRIDISTDDTFTATARRNTSLSTAGAGAGEGSIRITFGDENSEVEGFRVGNSTATHHTSGIIVSAQSEIVTGEFPASYSQADIELINRGIPIAEEIPVAAPPQQIQPPQQPPISTPVASEESEVMVSPLATNSVDDDTFAVVETTVGQEFSQYFGLEDTERPTATLAQVQQQLVDVAQSSGITPALMYVYFVPDAASEAAVNPNADAAHAKAVDPVTTGLASSPAKIDSGSSDNDELEVMLITADGQTTRQRQWGVTRQQVNKVARQLRQETTSQFSTPRQYLPPAQQLYDWIVSPVADLLQQQQVQSLGFVMDTGLRTLPLAALHDGDRYLVENYSLGILPTFSLTDFSSDRDNLRAAKAQADIANQTPSSASHRDFREGAVLAMGASEFKDQPDLPAVDEEVTLITQQLWEGDAFLNEDFVLDTLRSQISGKDYGIVHLATHANFQSDNLDESYIQMWDERLALSDISQLGLSDADIGLIILSACNTAMGDHNSEYGFAGFAIQAGSSSALASIWPVSDEGTLGFMSQFYSELRPATIRAEALRQAQMKMIAGDVGIEYGNVYGPDNEVITTISELAESGQWDFSHPFFWSAFTMIGNPW